MSAERSWLRSVFTWKLGAACVVAALGMYAYFSCKPAGEDIPIIASGAEYTDRLKEAADLSQQPLLNAELGNELTQIERTKLRKALAIFKGLIAFRPDGFGPYFGAAKICQALDDPTQALGYMNAFLSLAPKTKNEDIRRSIAEAFYIGGQCQEKIGAYENAEFDAGEALKLYPNTPDFLAALASAKLQLGKVPEAKALVGKALLIDPKHKRGLQLEKLLIAAGEK